MRSSSSHAICFSIVYTISSGFHRNPKLLGKIFLFGSLRWSRKIALSGRKSRNISLDGIEDHYIVWLVCAHLSHIRPSRRRKCKASMANIIPRYYISNRGCLSFICTSHFDSTFIFLPSVLLDWLLPSFCSLLKSSCDSLPNHHQAPPPTTPPLRPYKKVLFFTPRSTFNSDAHAATVPFRADFFSSFSLFH